ncbi:MAG: hypothetical protein AB1916_04955 [Thermodesulfobacteriota bacterium]
MAQAVLVFLLSVLAAGCSDQAPEPRPVAEANATSANATAANATAANATAANATAAPGEASPASVLADPPLGNSSLPVSVVSPEQANATQAAGGPPVPARGDKAPAKPERLPARPVKATASPAPSPAKAKAAPASSGPLTLERAQEEFGAFARQWVAVLSRNMLGNAARMAVSPDAGGYVARFAEVDQDSLEFEVKATDTPGCPYVGVLKYFECSYESRGDSPESAKAGAFSQVRKVRVTELFRHSGKRWE